MHVLVVEDDRSTLRMLARWLEDSGYAVSCSDTARGASTQLRAGKFDAVIMDVGLPDGNGIDLCREMRRQGNNAPVLVLTAHASGDQIVHGLDAGADDYVSKPAALDQIGARLRALLRRGRNAEGTTLHFGDIELDLLRRSVTRAGMPVRLTAREFSLLEHFMRTPERMQTRSEIAQHVWGVHFDNRSNVIEVSVSALRRKLGHPRVIHTLIGAGYILSLTSPA